VAIGASWEVESPFTPQKRDGQRLVQWRFLNNERKAKSPHCDIFTILEMEAATDGAVGRPDGSSEA
jgi:hypothetical protein